MQIHAQVYKTAYRASNTHHSTYISSMKYEFIPQIGLYGKKTMALTH